MALAVAQGLPAFLKFLRGLMLRLVRLKNLLIDRLLPGV
jgi:hypothetical protein